jgi:hypothetical protein
MPEPKGLEPSPFLRDVLKDVLNSPGTKGRWPNESISELDRGNIGDYSFVGPPMPLSELDKARQASDLAIKKNDYEAAIPHLRKQLELLKFDPEKGAQPEHISPAFRLAMCLMQTAGGAGSNEAEKYFKAAADALDEQPGREGDKARLHGMRGSNLAQLASYMEPGLERFKLLQSAESSLSKSVILAEGLLGKDHKDLMAAHAQLAVVMARRGHDGTAHFDEAIRLSKLHKAEPHDLALLYREKARNYVTRSVEGENDPKAAKAALDEGINLVEGRKDAPSRSELVMLLTDRSLVHINAKDYPAAQKDLSQAFKIMLSDPEVGADGRGPKGLPLADLYTKSALLLEATGKPGEAKAARQTAEDIIRYHSLEKRFFDERLLPMVEKAQKKSETLAKLAADLKEVPWASLIRRIGRAGTNETLYDPNTSTIIVGARIPIGDVPQKYAYAAYQATHQSVYELYRGDKAIGSPEDTPLSYKDYKRIRVNDLAGAFLAELNVASELKRAEPVTLSFKTKEGEVTKDLRDFVVRDMESGKIDQTKTKAKLAKFLDEEYLQQGLSPDRKSNLADLWIKAAYERSYVPFYAANKKGLSSGGFLKPGW